MPKKTNNPESLWSRYGDHECVIHQYFLGTDTDRVLKQIDTEIPVAEHERIEILRMLGFDPNSTTAWIGINREYVRILEKDYLAGRIFAGESKEPRSRFAVVY